MARTIDWVDGDIVIIDQTLLPAEERVVHLREVSELAEAIRALRVRGAPALGVAGALGLALAASRASERGQDVAQAVGLAAEILAATRPTAANLRWGIDRVRPLALHGPRALVDGAVALLEEDVATNRRMALRGAALVNRLHARLGRGLRLMTHCNTGALACVEWGTALGVIRAAQELGMVGEVLATETRPLLQGSRLTAWELGRMRIPYRLIVDAAAPSLLARGAADAVLVGADRIAANFDVANKIGTYPLALAAQRAGVPFIVVAPESTIDIATPTGVQVRIEERGEGEVVAFAGRQVAPDGARALNPAFDVTPADLITAIVTEERTLYPAGERSALTTLAG